MKTKPMDLSKLPKWAQEHIADLKRQRDHAIRDLDEHEDNQTPTPFFYETFCCDGKQGKAPTPRRYYFESHRHMTVEYMGVRLEIILRDRGIDLSWAASGKRVHEVVPFVPTSYQAARLEGVKP